MTELPSSNLNPFALSVEQVINQATQIDDHERQVKEQVIEEKSLLLAGVIKQLALQRTELTDNPTPKLPQDLVLAANTLAQSLNLQSYILFEQIPRKDAALPIEAATWIRAKRRATGLSQEEFGMMFGVSRFIIIRMEAGKSHPRETFKKILDYFEE
jgi:DNA-binding transcriptional regulator YiaG